MIIAFTLNNNSNQSTFSKTFGRCNYIKIINSERNIEKFIKNPFSSSLGSSGIQASQLLIENSCEVIITKQIGDQALTLLNSVGIKVYKSEAETASDAYKLFQENKLQKFNI